MLVSAAPESPGPHALAAPRLDGRGRLGEYLQSAEAAIVRDASTTSDRRRAAIFTMRPDAQPDRAVRFRRRLRRPIRIDGSGLPS